MSDWEDIGNGMEAQSKNQPRPDGTKTVTIRQKGQSTKYPHFSVQVDKQGNTVNFHASETGTKGFGSREVVYAAISILKGKGLL